MGGAGAGGMAGTDVSADECIARVMAAGTTVTDCETCLCQPGNCQAELDAMDGNAPANAMIDCIKGANCDATCCLCGAMCDSGGSNFGNGPCSDEIQTAAGVTPMTGVLGGIANGAMVMTNCSPDGPADNACAIASRLGACIKDKCAAMCTQAPACM